MLCVGAFSGLKVIMYISYTYNVHMLCVSAWLISRVLKQMYVIYICNIYVCTMHLHIGNTCLCTFLSFMFWKIYILKSLFLWLYMSYMQYRNRAWIFWVCTISWEWIVFVASLLDFRWLLLNVYFHQMFLFRYSCLERNLGFFCVFPYICLASNLVLNLMILHVVCARVCVGSSSAE